MFVTTAWAFATCDQAVVQRRRFIGNLKPQELANTAWAFATFVRQKRSCSRSGQLHRSGGSVGDFTPQELADTALAFATFVQGDARLVAFLTFATPSPQEIANTARAFTTVAQARRSCSQPGIGAEKTNCNVSVGNYKSQELANTARAFAAFGQADAKLFATWAWQQTSQFWR